MTLFLANEAKLAVIIVLPVPPLPLITMICFSGDTPSAVDMFIQSVLKDII
jgi:hypothetical protein